MSLELKTPFLMVSGGPESFKHYVISLLGVAKNSVSMSTSMYPGFYNDPDVKQAFESCVLRVKSFRLLLDGRVNLSKLRDGVPWLFELKKRSPHLEIKKAGSPIVHWIIVDDQHLRLEVRHGLEEYAKRNVIIFSAPPSTVEVVKRVFEGWWGKARVVK
ncbi:MAG: hypothetical protein DRJ31_04975 [Candidatus Methanomethylicota archaeon]|uniref:Uncharacterized protein n=1 Tax=Thermoproteota archaeon TaxID=2056631 RepID=A0A497EQB2_9CREN|nr:MAG: hypothetical protein DRJ31_04975 [Candidatus Verstraetearchaeota archaeon]RLE53518.1 MAG: hypothetical protein DRJ33_00785 [Candidatus Verstraetearchaeota archaeon]